MEVPHFWGVLPEAEEKASQGGEKKGDNEKEEVAVTVTETRCYPRNTFDARGDRGGAITHLTPRSSSQVMGV